MLKRAFSLHYSHRCQHHGQVARELTIRLPQRHRGAAALYAIAQAVARRELTLLAFELGRCTVQGCNRAEVDAPLKNRAMRHIAPSSLT